MERRSRINSRPWVTACLWVLLIVSARYHWRWSDHDVWLDPRRCNVDDLCESSAAGAHRAASLIVIAVLSVVLIALRMLEIARESPVPPQGGDELRPHRVRDAGVTAGIVALLCVAVLAPAYALALIVVLGVGPIEAGLLMLAVLLALVRLLGRVFRVRWRSCSSRRAAVWGFAVAVCAVVGSAAAIFSSSWIGFGEGAAGGLRLVAFTCVGVAVAGVFTGGRPQTGLGREAAVSRRRR